MPPDREVQQTLCRMCDDRCGIDVHLEHGRIVDIVGNKEHLWNHGRVCAKARGAVDMVYHPDRIVTPLKRTADGFEEIPLEQALDESAARIVDVKERYGARYAGYTVVDGDWPLADVENARCIVIWGANPPHAHPNMTHYVTRARRAGATLVVVDPRLSAIARRADLHAELRPGTDGALAWGLIRQLIETGAYAKDFVERHTLGFSQVAEHAEAFTLEAVQEETGVASETIRDIARAMGAAAPRAAVYVGNGLEHHENGVNNIRAIAMFDGLLGSVDVEGGNRYGESLGLRDLTLYEERPLRRLDPADHARRRPLSVPRAGHHRSQPHADQPELHSCPPGVAVARSPCGA